VTAYVIDASVVVKWFIPEAHSESALRLKDVVDVRLHAPAFLALEIGNVLAKKRRRDELSSADTEDIWRAFRRAPIHRHTDDTLVLAAFHLAYQTKTSLYDNLYLALGVKLDIPLLTADRKFYDALRMAPYRDRMCWIDNV